MIPRLAPWATSCRPLRGLSLPTAFCFLPTIPHWTLAKRAGYNPASHARRIISEVQLKIVSTAATAFRLAARLERVGFSDIVQIRNRIMELRAAGATVYQFEGGEPFL